MSDRRRLAAVNVGAGMTPSGQPRTSFRGYRPGRIPDTDPLPLLFAPAQPRRTAPANDAPAGDEVEEPEPSMWR